MRISLILPYWNRQQAANRGLESIAKCYPDLDLEVVIVDDGSERRFEIPDLPLDITVVRMPEKKEPKSPCTTWNVGVSVAEGDIVLLSCVEMIHRKPVIKELVDELLEIGGNGYVIASAWCPDENKWHCHSTVKTPRNPRGTGISFLTAIHKELYWRAGGFDEDYRDGAGYEDNDFINRLMVSGAHFKIRDDLMVLHPKKDATINWGAGKFKRNEDLYRSKWPNGHPEMLVFCCVNWGNYLGRGEEYVRNLFNGIRNNLGAYACRFVLFSDDSRDYGQGITTLPLPEGVAGWWNKLYLFKEGVFGVKEKIIFFDLDTVIMDDITFMAEYSGDFAILEDAYNPHMYGPGIMMWKGGFGYDIWQSYVDAGMPTENSMGDMWWINQWIKKSGITPDKLQSLYPRKFGSYKKHVLNGKPDGESVVFFHGKPRPHEVNCRVGKVWGCLTP